MDLKIDNKTKYEKNTLHQYISNADGRVIFDTIATNTNYD